MGSEPNGGPFTRHGTVATRRAVVAALSGLLVVGLVGCTNSASPPHGSATCAFSVSYHGTGYTGTYPPVPFETAERIGTATIPPCNDTGQDYEGPVDTLAAYRAVGLAPSDAIAVRYGPDNALQLLAAYAGSGTPPAVAAYIAERNPNGSILVTPDRDLHDFDTVTVTLRGLDPGSEAMIAQCAPAQESYACLTRSTGEIPPASSPSSASPATADPGRQAPTPTTAVPGPNTFTQVTLPVHEPLRGDLKLFDADGDPVSHRKAPGQIACHGAEALSCLVAVRGTRNGDRVVRYAQIHFAVAMEPHTSPPH
ncbi:MAG TPA: DUF6281 family protein [Acidimicrobiales bacterium]|nr:DUF6281 family protein [Acidimicrobiales bacterium]